MAIAPIGAGLTGITPIGITGTKPATQAKGDAFGAFMDSLDGLQQTQNNADGLAVKAATGDLNDIHAYTIAATEASLATELTVAVRNRAVEAFNEIMRMPV